MTKSLQDKIESLDKSFPYVWKLKLSEADFKEIETCLESIANKEGIPALTKTDNAIMTIAYMAEWYKRRYQSGNRCELTDGINLETLWDNAGISKKRYLYKDENGNKRWLYSIYVLGGLAIQHELDRNDNMRFLKGLCRIYNGENYTLENVDDASRATAFRESIKCQHSLYEYLREILNGDMPFNQEDLADETSDVNRFVSTIKAANDEILKVKFRFEWVVNFSPDYNYMTRRLIVWLKPEEVGGGLNQYLRYDRVHLWGISNPDKQLHLYVYVRFKYGDEIIDTPTAEMPIITYLNHNVNDFVTIGIEKRVPIKHLPATIFDKIELIVKDDDGNEFVVQVQEVPDFMQLWRFDSFSDTWTSSMNTQKETALLFSNRCRLNDENACREVFRKRFRDQIYGTSEIWNWAYIYDSISFSDRIGKDYTLFNRVGYDQVTTRLYSNVIHYVNGGKVKHVYIDDPDVSDIPEVDEYPLIFGPDDLIARHFATKDNILNSQPESDTLPENIEWNNSGGRYVEWTDENMPPFGVVRLRLTIKGKTYLFTVIHLPRLDAESPIKRDYYSSFIRFRDFDNNVVSIRDEIVQDGKTLFPTLSLKYGDSTDYYELDVYRPTLQKEVILDGNIIKYLDGNDKLYLPYILKNRVQLNDFSEHGYQSYDCKDLNSIYSQDYLDIEHNPSVGMAALSVWNKDASYAGKLLDPIAPESLVVCFGRSRNDPYWDGQEALFWNYDKEINPIIASPNDKPDFGIIFQNLSKNKDLICNYPIQVDDDPWGFEDVEVSLLKCFEVANESGTYFFIMKPLVEMNKNDIVKQIIKPLLESREGILTEIDKYGLIRLGEEFGFDWKELTDIIGSIK